MSIDDRQISREVEIIPIDPEALPAAVTDLLCNGGRMQMAYAWRRPDDQIELRYLGARAREQSFFLWKCEPKGPVPSMAVISPLLGWYEREMADLFGVKFRDHPEPFPLIAPVNEEFTENTTSIRMERDASVGEEEHDEKLPEINNPDVQRLSFGPVRADVFESVELIFYYVGEHILHFHPHLFLKHRGMERCFEGLLPARGVILAERVSGVGSFAHALAYCQAVEWAARCEVPQRAGALRSLFAELERLYNHLHYLGHLSHTTTLKVGEAQGKLLEEEVKQINGRLCGSRFLRNLLIPGGLRRDISSAEWLRTELERLRRRIVTYAKMLESTNSHLDRLLTTGILQHDVAFDQGATGPIQRASGFDRDLRRDHPYAAYKGLGLKIPVKSAGDAHARAQVRIEEIDASISVILRILQLLKDGPICVPCCPPANSEGLGWAESPRGSLFYAIHTDPNGLLSRVKIKSPSYSNWRVFPLTVHGTNMMDYAINEASFGLTVSGCDR